MKKQAVLSVLGDDRVGAADDLAAMLDKLHINIAHSRMAALGGRFAIIAQLCGEEDCVADLRRELPTMRTQLGFRLELSPAEPAQPSMKEPHLLIESFSAEPTGLNAMTAFLRGRHVNIEELEIDASPAPCTSRTTFHLKASVTLPPSISVDAIGRELRQLERDRNLEVTVKPIAEPVAH